MVNLNQLSILNYTRKLLNNKIFNESRLRVSGKVRNYVASKERLLIVKKVLLIKKILRLKKFTHSTSLIKSTCN